MFARYVTIADLPRTLAIFPLTGALLLPRGSLPLNIFEPRYLAMVDDAMRGSRVIAMIQPRVSERTERTPPLYSVGCAGRITSYAETDDNRLLITLTGLCRFRLDRELAVTTPYRQATPDYGPFAGDLSQPDDEAVAEERGPLLANLKPYLDAQQMHADWSAIERAPLAQLVDTLATLCPFDANEKQALLEAETVVQRARMLTALITMANADAPSGPEGPLQ